MYNICIFVHLYYYVRNIMKIKNFIRRISKEKKIHGLHSIPKLIASKIYIKIRKKYRLLFNDHNHVWVYDDEPIKVILPEEITIKSFEKIESIPKEAFNKMKEELGDTTKDWLNAEFREGSILWLLFVNNEFAVRQFIRYGKYFNTWFLPLNEKDFVFMAAGTFPEYRGKSLNPILKRYIMHNEMKNGGKAYVDCKVWNKSAISALKKNNFRYLKTMKNYWEGNSIKDRVATFKNKLLH